MKKLSLIFAVLMLVSTLFTSCIKDDTVSGNTDNVNGDVVDNSSTDEPEKTVDNSADTTENGVDDVTDEEELNLFEMTREEQIEFLKPYILALDNDASFLAEHSEKRYTALYEADAGEGAEIKHLVKDIIPSGSNRNVDGEWVSILTIGDWQCESYDSGKYIVSGELFNSKGESIGDRPWKYANELYPVTDSRFKKIEDLKEYYRSHISEELIINRNLFEQIGHNYTIFDDGLYFIHGARGYYYLDIDFENMEIIVTDNHSCVVTAREYWGVESYCEHTYRFDIRHGKFLLTESETGEWVSLY